MGKAIKKPRKSRGTGAKRGRPTKFTDVVQEKIMVMAKQGATDIEIASAVGVTERTINYWKAKSDDFFQALKHNKDLADQMVEASLFQRALGYRAPAVKHFLDRRRVEDEVTGESRIETVVIEKEFIEAYPPDTVAAIFWLKNRQPDRWRDKPDPNPLPPADGNSTTVIYEAEWGGNSEPSGPVSDAEGE